MLPGELITEISQENSETVLVIAAQKYLRALGFWLVLVTGIF